jgi:protein phosphatase
VGKKRVNNEDTFLTLLPSPTPTLPIQGVLLAADGMGGHERGEVASALALEELVGAVQQGEALLAAVHAAHLAIVAAAQPVADEAGMGSTLVAVRLDGEEFELAWVGDSRAYRIGCEHIEQLTHDHSWVQAMVDAGQMSAEEAREHPRRNVILQCLGQVGQVPDVGLLRARLAPDELLLLCSDGLTNELDDAAIQHCCAEAATLEAMVEQLVGLANSHGGRDNVSCIVLGLGPAAEPHEARPPGLLRKLFKSLQP